ncbi:helix-turn-helix domain-containing protein [Streptomyces sp. NBRC 110611]|uniref:helix-turn-helix domain-containing protein n=1 Tax=Streptomyces sp. NBRC 110611 TaxID=1621259 RepID=UPI0011BDE9F6|nr:helix-turn-helix domain-containing protein [Streptomyces sp. NBRC 110611]
MSTDTLAAIRFAVSPLMQAGAVLHPRRPRAASRTHLNGQQVDAALRERGLHLLSALRREIHGYAPDFLTPGPGSDLAPDVDVELHQVATTPSPIVARQMNRVLQSAALPKRTSASELPGVRDFLELGEQAFAQQAADELASFWQRRLAPMWPALSARAEADIDHRARIIARGGLHTALNSLHRDIAYDRGALRLENEQQLEVSGTTDVTLFPSTLAHSWLISVDPWHERGIHLVYPVRPHRPAHRPQGKDRTAEGTAPSLGNVIGHSRSLVLTGLDVPRTTTQLAARHHLSPSTVSYHLSRLLRAGLVTRVRDGNRVYYQRTTDADRLCGRPTGHDATGRRGAGHDGAGVRRPEGVVST